MAASSASMIQASGRQEAEEVRKRGREIGGKQMTGFAKAGVRLDKGTPVQVMANTAARAELAAMRTQFAFDMKAWEVQAAANRGAASIASSALMSMGSLLMGYTGGGGGGLKTTNLYGTHGSAVNTIPSIRSVNFGSIA
jgi:hypothetical protein